MRIFVIECSAVGKVWLSMNPIGVGVWTYGTCSDRYVGDGYKEKMSLLERIEHIGAMPDAKAIEITYPNDINSTNYEQYKPLLDKNDLSICAIGVDLACDREWKTGSFSSPVQEIRDKTIALVKEAMDFAASIDCGIINLWLGQDGFDYLFQVDYVQARNNLVNGIRECADHNPSVRLGIEYKLSEPRLKCMVDTAGTALSICQSVGRDNVGVTMDVGHSLMAKENPAEVAAILLSQNRLFHLHLNDNYLMADDDMPTGSVHFLHFMELFYWLKRCGYQGWYSLDMYPYRDDPDEAVRSSIRFIRGMERFVDDKLGDIRFSDELNDVPSNVLNNLFSKIFD